MASEVLANDLLETFNKTPRLATAVLWVASRDEAMVVEHLVEIGRRDATERMAHFLLEAGARLKLVGLGSSSGYACPLSQYMLADALRLMMNKGLMAGRTLSGQGSRWDESLLMP